MPYLWGWLEKVRISFPVGGGGGFQWGRKQDSTTSLTGVYISPASRLFSIIYIILYFNHNSLDIIFYQIPVIYFILRKLNIKIKLMLFKLNIN